MVTSAVKIIHVALFMYYDLFSDAANSSNHAIFKRNFLFNPVGGTLKYGHNMIN
jgi:hypothetical protein